MGRGPLLAIAVYCLTPASCWVCQAATLNLQILDERGESCAARLRVFDAAGNAVAVEPVSAVIRAHPRFPELGVIADGRASIRLPATRVTIRIERGPEYRTTAFEADGSAGRDLERSVRLERWISMAERGWWSGDLHVHRSPDDVGLLLQAADLHFAPTIGCFNDEFTLVPWPTEVRRRLDSRTYSVDNCEDERPWGAALFIGVKSPMRLYRRNAQYPSPLTTWREARERGGFIDLEKLIWWQAPVLAALAPPDTLGVAVNHFQEETVATRASLSRPRDEKRYPGPLGFARYVLDLYDTYLSAGFRIPASAGSANGVVRNAFGFNRSYVHLGRGFSAESWLQGQKAGRNFVTNGPMLFVTVNGKVPGQVFEEPTGEVQVGIDALSPRALDRVEIVVDGRVAAVGRGSERAIRMRRRVAVEEGSWLLVRCFERNTDTLRFAQSSPFWFGRQAKRSKEALSFLREWIDADLDRLRLLPEDRIDGAQRAELLKISQRAREFYE